MSCALPIHHTRPELLAELAEVEALNPWAMRADQLAEWADRKQRAQWAVVKEAHERGALGPDITLDDLQAEWEAREVGLAYLVADGGSLVPVLMWGDR